MSGVLALHHRNWTVSLDTCPHPALQTRCELICRLNELRRERADSGRAVSVKYDRPTVVYHIVELSVVESESIALSNERRMNRIMDESVSGVTRLDDWLAGPTDHL